LSAVPPALKNNRDMAQDAPLSAAKKARLASSSWAAARLLRELSWVMPAASSAMMTSMNTTTGRLKPRW